MPSEAPVLPTQTEKPHHYTYLKEFRTQQCALFLQHKCTQHRPYTCFHWHFMNQRRRRPVRKRDGTFNYSPDVYCTKYDETTGICPEGDDCPLLHRTAGDTERRYHLRYYKTCTCVYETDARGHCAKNGAHCAFAHGAHDLRPPVYDVRELQVPDTTEKMGDLSESPLGSSLEKDRIINEDPRWNDTNYVLANYKTEQCKRPPRLCRQGYACPSYHNTRDRRRSPKKFKYRSTPCPNVKHGDDWGDPSQCENGDNCSYCHTRTEQQFHPEIYKSTKCNDMVQTGYCPRGPFCAFAHVEQEMTSAREVGSPADTTIAAFVTSLLPEADKAPEHSGGGGKWNDDAQKRENGHETSNCIVQQNNNVFLENLSCSDNGMNGGSIIPSNSNLISTVSITTAILPEPIGKGRTGSFSSSMPLEGGFPGYQKAPGSEREDVQVKLRQQIQAIDSDPVLDTMEKLKRKQNLLLLHNMNIGSPSSSYGSNPTTPLSPASSSQPSSAMSPHAPSFYPAGDTVESVIGNALDLEDLNLGELSLNPLDRDVRDTDNDTNSVCSSISTGFPSSYLGATSVPVTIPSSSGYQRNSIGSLSQSPSSSPAGSFLQTFIPQHVQQQQKQEQQLQEAALAFLSQPNPGKFSAPGYQNDNSSMSPRTHNSTSNAAPQGVNGYGEVQRLREELQINKSKLSQWEEGISQARGACEAWKKEAEESTRKAKVSEEDRSQAIKQRDEAVLQLKQMKQELDLLRSGMASQFLHSAQRTNELDSLSVQHLKQLQAQLRVDLDTVDKTVYKHTTPVTVKCIVCHERNRCVRLHPCNHYAVCDKCSAKLTECPVCHSQITQRSNAVLPM